MNKGGTLDGITHAGSLAFLDPLGHPFAISSASPIDLHDIASPHPIPADSERGLYLGEAAQPSADAQTHGTSSVETGASFIEAGRLEEGASAHK